MIGFAPIGFYAIGFGPFTPAAPPSFKPFWAIQASRMTGYLQ